MMNVVTLWRRVASKIRQFIGREDDFISVVILLPVTRELTEASLRDAAARTWDAKFDSGDQATRDLVVVRPPIALVKLQGHVLHIINSSRPYFDDPAAVAGGIDDLRTKKAVLDHRAWMSVDYMSGRAPLARSRDQKYAAVAKLASGLLGEDYVGIAFPGDELIFPASKEIVDHLANFTTIKTLSSFVRPPVLELTPEQTAAAVAEAQSRWPEFLTAFQKRKTGDIFFVKKRFSEGEDAEWMWISVKAIEGNRILGVLDSEPVFLKNVRPGLGVQLEVADVEDWVFKSGKTTCGGFTSPAT
jgi:uncharacterized protein YegJ (DUF2314 family)